MFRAFLCSAALGIGLAAASAHAEDEIGCVSTVFKMLGPNDKICIYAFNDPKVEGVTCHLSRPTTGGFTGAVGLAEDRSFSSIACRQTGPVRLPDDLEDGEEVFKKRISLITKSLQVVRFFDQENNTLVYLSYSDKIIEGSYKNAISTVPIMPWRE